MSHNSGNTEELRELLKSGYAEMAEINLEEAEYGLESANEALRVYEQKLTECE